MTRLPTYPFNWKEFHAWKHEQKDLLQIRNGKNKIIGVMNV